MRVGLTTKSHIAHSSRFHLFLWLHIYNSWDSSWLSFSFQQKKRGAGEGNQLMFGKLADSPAENWRGDRRRGKSSSKRIVYQKEDNLGFCFNPPCPPPDTKIILQSEISISKPSHQQRAVTVGIIFFIISHFIEPHVRHRDGATFNWALKIFDGQLVRKKRFITFACPDSWVSR